MMENETTFDGSLWSAVAIALLGFAAIYLFLPRPRKYWRAGALACAVLALVLLGAVLSGGLTLSVESLLFCLFSFIAIVSGGLLVTLDNPLRGALSFALVVLSTCGLFLLQAAPFLMAATTIIYAGAIIVTFIFLIMLAQQAGGSDADLRSYEPLLTSAAGFCLLATLLYMIRSMGAAYPLGLTSVQEESASLPADNVAALGQLLFTDYLLPVELAGVLLLVATIGAVAIASRRPEEPS
jgi:NADH-quinone oxidoreductase subunit J